MSDTTRLVVVCGLPGAGKSTVASAVADRLDATVFRTDVVRKELFPDPSYTDEESRRTYEALFERADDRLAAGDPVVLDGTFRRANRRREARSLAERRGVTARLVRVRCDERTAKARIRSREDDPSDADTDVYDLLREEFEPVEDPVVVDNSGDLDATLARVRSLF
ncbi:AAA family ATPase [Halobaculum magnesiiphilum]|uniref:AAA family ATPase n=1 Tax=Halobaculum magnesiiphilum TaxID=1017351 RepID=A0A8T8WGJ3_9EURY|nr:AAA family ATPase [Halobaculum magnesiiphilum]QZP38950.1 AAA family ATPase [Halobaculum magnesiiphilum]